MCLHIILAEILREIDASHYTPYKRRSRWKIKWKKKINDGVKKIINVTGEQLHKVLKYLPNYKTRHKNNHRWWSRTYYNKRKIRYKKKSMRNQIIKIMSLRLAPSRVLTHACATHVNAQSRSTPLHTNFHISSYDIYVDNCASRSITNNMSDFIEEPTQAKYNILSYQQEQTTVPSTLGTGSQRQVPNKIGYLVCNLR
jgi:hypothetical protein